MKPPFSRLCRRRWWLGQRLLKRRCKSASMRCTERSSSYFILQNKTLLQYCDHPHAQGAPCWDDELGREDEEEGSGGKC